MNLFLSFREFNELTAAVKAGSCGVVVIQIVFSIDDMLQCTKKQKQPT